MSLPNAIATPSSLSQLIFPTHKGNWLVRNLAMATSRTVYNAAMFEPEMQKPVHQKYRKLQHGPNGR